MDKKIGVMANRWLCWGEVLNSDGTVHFRRLPLFLSKRFFSVYIHHFVAPETTREPHDHPKWFLSIGLWGGYRESVYCPASGFSLGWHFAPWIRYFPATHTHKITGVNNAWTLVITGPVTRAWGFWRKGEWIEAHAYMDQLNAQESAE